MISTILTAQTQEDVPVCKSAPDSWNSALLSFLPLAEGLFERKGYLTYRVLLYPTSPQDDPDSQVPPRLHLAPTAVSLVTRIGLSSYWLRVNQYLLLILKRGAESITLPQPAWQRL